MNQWPPEVRRKDDIQPDNQEDKPRHRNSASQQVVPVLGAPVLPGPRSRAGRGDERAGNQAGGTNDSRHDGDPELQVHLAQGVLPFSVRPVRAARQDCTPGRSDPTRLERFGPTRERQVILHVERRDVAAVRERLSRPQVYRGPAGP